jgi:hypothetical protein
VRKGEGVEYLTIDQKNLIVEISNNGPVQLENYRTTSQSLRRKGLAQIFGQTVNLTELGKKTAEILKKTSGDQ